MINFENFKFTPNDSDKYDLIEIYQNVSNDKNKTPNIWLNFKRTKEFLDTVKEETFNLEIIEKVDNKILVNKLIANAYLAYLKPEFMLTLLHYYEESRKSTGFFSRLFQFRH